MKFRLIEKVFTPNGAWDNHRWSVSPLEIDFPEKLLQEKAILEEVVCKGINGLQQKITIDGNSWVVEGGYIRQKED